MSEKIRHIGNVFALCDDNKKAHLREDLGVERYKRLGISERFKGEEPYRICAKCIQRVGNQKFMVTRHYTAVNGRKKRSPSQGGEAK